MREWHNSSYVPLDGWRYGPLRLSWDVSAQLFKYDVPCEFDDPFVYSSYYLGANDLVSHPSTGHTYASIQSKFDTSRVEINMLYYEIEFLRAIVRAMEKKPFRGIPSRGGKVCYNIFTPDGRFYNLESIEIVRERCEKLQIEYDSLVESTPSTSSIDNEDSFSSDASEASLDGFISMESFDVIETNVLRPGSFTVAFAVTPVVVKVVVTGSPLNVINLSPKISRGFSITPQKFPTHPLLSFGLYKILSFEGIVAPLFLCVPKRRITRYPSQKVNRSMSTEEKVNKQKANVKVPYHHKLRKLPSKIENYSPKRYRPLIKNFSYSFYSKCLSRRRWNFWIKEGPKYSKDGIKLNRDEVKILNFMFNNNSYVQTTFNCSSSSSDRSSIRRVSDLKVQPPDKRLASLPDPLFADHCSKCTFPCAFVILHVCKTAIFFENSCMNPNCVRYLFHVDYGGPNYEDIVTVVFNSENITSAIDEGGIHSIHDESTEFLYMFKAGISYSLNVLTIGKFRYTLLLQSNIHGVKTPFLLFDQTKEPCDFCS